MSTSAPVSSKGNFDIFVEPAGFRGTVETIRIVLRNKAKLTELSPKILNELAQRVHRIIVEGYNLKKSNIELVTARNHTPFELYLIPYPKNSLPPVIKKIYSLFLKVYGGVRALFNCCRKSSSNNQFSRITNFWKTKFIELDALKVPTLPIIPRGEGNFKDPATALAHRLTVVQKILRQQERQGETGVVYQETFESNLQTTNCPHIYTTGRLIFPNRE